ncbi:MAG: TetM/TetW/TetO/TetS family tetracycline resistance ribosomal protection protein [Streptosporangiaceae bacterium]|nr:TetM/TetW/TetO/TetS family tetracycline resistance ribosomal protection protein [Streptosporangiaceae bacterium]
MRILNLGILAHVDAGKTSLTERLLYAAGVIDEVGRVDDGSTRTDTLALERQRGITIKSAVASFVIGEPADPAATTVNLIDTPGHPDFIAEVERVLSVLDGVVLVISAVEGVQAQTHVLMRALKRMRIPTLIFVNKIDRRGADCDRVLAQVADRLTPAAVPMGSVRLVGTRGADYLPGDLTSASTAARHAEVLAENDDVILAHLGDPRPIGPAELAGKLAAQTAQALVHPVFFGSAITGAGVGELMTGIRCLLPSASQQAGGPARGAVFKVERGAAGEKIAYVRMFTGTVRVRDRLPAGKVTAISVDGKPSESVRAGEIGRLWGLSSIHVGDPIGTPPIRTPSSAYHFAPPTLETIVVPRHKTDKGALYAALTQLAEQDPLINLRQAGDQTLLSLYGEVQKEVIQATLEADFGLDVSFQGSTVICVERPAGTGAAAEHMKAEGNPFLATVGLRVEPGELGSGVQFRLEIELGALPLAFVKAIEDTVRLTLRQGLSGWQVTDCVVALTESGYAPRQSHAHARFDKSMSSTGADFRGLVPLVVMEALRRAGTRVYEPVQRFHLSLPADAVGVMLPVLVRLGGIPETQVITGAAAAVDGLIPAARVPGVERQLPALTSGEGVLECVFDHYAQVRGPAPSRPRSDHNPLDRKEYLLRVTRGV